MNNCFVFLLSNNLMMNWMKHHTCSSRILWSSSKKLSQMSGYERTLVMQPFLLFFIVGDILYVNFSKFFFLNTVDQFKGSSDSFHYQIEPACSFQPFQFFPCSVCSILLSFYMVFWQDRWLSNMFPRRALHDISCPAQCWKLFLRSIHI